MLLMVTVMLGGVMVMQICMTSERKGCNNRMLVSLGWIVAKGSRENPRNTKCSLQDPERLMQLRKELLAARKPLVDSLAMVFGDEDEIWLERCESIASQLSYID
ncbi:uncharacterized protein B0I36DRAFT_341883 [Microdochium trichocladiopsis]|uniref:Uncharacterized protein n=1 Tax=Microdochium trichocladiopsis TaxID=1682393 RepID=A0A9P8XT27_9PEZI|nr:uncharacterized protein B0I36DRAFT_341883 [Microdochium trichocladiopsis]KAH7010649.1 hypothetical protein B0I36DRAFT_341883 [Microdochium trichocladiopsis]